MRTNLKFLAQRPLVPIATLTFVLLCAPALPAQNNQPRPGVTDPAGNPSNFTLFRDQQLFTMSPGSKATPWQTAKVGFEASLSPTAVTAQLPWAGSMSQGSSVDIQAVAGRIVHPDKDDIVMVQRSPSDSGQLSLRFADGTGKLDLPGGFALRSNLWKTDFFATAAGDLDRLYDSSGNYHDEVVTAWFPHNFINNTCLSVAVVNYNQPQSPVVTTGGISRSSCPGEFDGFLADNNAENPDYLPIPIDNVVATAVGDFDGDGYNEIAVASFLAPPVGYSALVVSILRYQNDGINASLSLVNSIEIPKPAGKTWSGTLSLAAGDFDGSGFDQLLVGSAYWWGDQVRDLHYIGGPYWSEPVLVLIKGGQIAASVTGAESSGASNANTEFAVSLPANTYVPRTVTLTGGVGRWAAVNGTWPVTLTAKGFSIPVDSSNFGSFSSQNIQFTAAAPLTQAATLEVPAAPGQSGPVKIDLTVKPTWIRVQLVPGLFHFDPSHGYGYRRRQAALGWNSVSPDSASDAHLAIIQVTSDDKITLAAQQNDLLNGFLASQTLTIAAGAFRGDDDTNDPTWSLLSSGIGAKIIRSAPYVSAGLINTVWKVLADPSNGDNLQLQRICAGKASINDSSANKSGIDPPYCPIWGTDAKIDWAPDSTFLDVRLPAIAADLNGHSLRLGAPVHFEITNPGKAQFILEQPPQHAAWLDLGPGPEVVTISRFPTFNTSMEDKEKKDFATKNEDHLDWTVGGSVQGTASQTVSVGGEAGPLKAAVETETTVTAKVAYDYNNVSSTYNSGYDAYTVGRNAATGTDDSLILETQVLDLWRYRIFGEGSNTGDPGNPNAFYEITLPGPSLLSNPGGRDVDWYQPLHEVGNILSYPGRDDVCSPSDIGPITIPNTDISNKVIPLISCSQQFYNGNSSSLSLTLDHQSAAGGSTNYTHKLHANVDLSYTTKTTFMVAGTGDVTKFGVDVDIHGGADWGHLNTSDNATTDATGITINSPQGDSEHAYPYYPILYNTTAGGLKVAYAVGDLTSSAAGSTFWKGNYGSKPDPALNLPNRFVATYGPGGNLDGWTPDTTIARKRMKGFVVRKAVVDPVTGIYPLLGSNPHDGDTVMLETRVYNYSISATPTGPVTVQFSVIPYDSATDNEICPKIPTGGRGGRVCPASARTVIGTGSSAPTGGQPTISLNARENGLMYLVWNTKGFGPKSGGFSAYRVYVDLLSNPNGPGELYPPERACAELPCDDDFGNEKIVDPGQNNEGWSLISVDASAIQGTFGNPPAVATRGTLTAQSAVGADSATSIVGKSPRNEEKRVVRAYLFQPLHLRITAFSNVGSPLQGYVTIFDGKPGDHKTTTLAAKLLLGLDPTGSSAWFEWTPTKTGPHHLYAVTQDSGRTVPLGDLIAEVRRAPCDLNEDGRVDRHDLNMLQRDLGRAVPESACGPECDLDDDGMITQRDLDLMARLCDSQDCGFAKPEYVGGPSLLEPDMRVVRSADEAVTSRFMSDHPDDSELITSAENQGEATSVLYHAELKRKQAAQSIQYYYKGRLVTNGPYAAQGTFSH